jgi:phosphoserine phosphatase RsbU/P
VLFRSGVAQVLNTTTGAGFTPECKAIALRLGEIAALAIKRAALLESERAKQRYEADLAIARQIQEAAQAGALPTIDGYDIATSFHPADETGGDAFDVVDLRQIEDRAGARAEALLFLADATGHGVGPAISSVSTLAMIRLAARLGGWLDSIARAVNRQSCDDLPTGRFVTAFIGELDAPEGVIRWVSAGQAPLLHVRADERLDEERESFMANAPPLGVIEDFEPDDAPPFALGAGDLFAVLSDGYFETASPSGELFGTTRVLDVLHAHKNAPASEALDRLLEEVVRFGGGAPAADDRTGIIVKRL